MKRVKHALDSAMLDTLGIQIKSNFLPKDIVKELAEIISASRDRKLTYEIADFFPAIVQAAKVVESVMNRTKINKAVLKRYVPGESSGAFDFHVDPPEYKGYLFLCSLTGKATLFISTLKHGILQLDCSPNTFIALPVTLPHKVSPPDPKYGVRALLFLGHRDLVE